MTRLSWRRAAAWIERWAQPLAFAAPEYVSTQDPEPEPDLKDQLEAILACVRHEELKWSVQDRIRNISRRRSHGN
jgi:hypothetical protein